MKKFAVGMVAGAALTAVTAYAAGFRHWNRGEIEAANELFHDRSGLHFSVDDDANGNQTLTVHAHAVDGLAQDLAVTARPVDSTFPPGPCFVAYLEPPGPPQLPPGPCRTNGVCLQLLHPEQVSIVGADGAPLVCEPPGPPVVPVDTVP